MTLTIIKSIKWSFTIKLLLAAALIALADAFFWGLGTGSVIGAFALAWWAASLAAHRSAWHNKMALGGFAIAAFMAAILIFEPSLLGWILFWAALSVAVLIQRSARFGDAWQWARRLLLHAVTGPFGPLLDLGKRSRARQRIKVGSWTMHLPSLALPALGGAVFLSLFAIANPIISDALSRIDLSNLDVNHLWRAVFWGAVLLIIWSSLRPRRFRFAIRPLADSEPAVIGGVSVLSVMLSLILFNAMFAVQNILDIAFLWRGARLPENLTLAQYAHSGAYPLIATALLAGLFILITTHPKSAMAGNKVIRILIILWTLQNLFLVASSVERTMLYVESFSLTRLRIAAFIWMGLVALGLVLILWRMLTQKSLAWLVNGNALAAIATLMTCSIVDLGSVAARYNVAHKRISAGRPVLPDLCYLEWLGSAAMLPLADLEAQPNLPDEYRQRVNKSRVSIVTSTERQQQDWRHWTWRDAQRLAALPPAMLGKPISYDSGCNRG